MSVGIHSGRDVDEDLSLDADVIVVGSGAGGAVVATELATAGWRVVVLEEGPNVPAAAYGAMRPSESLRHAWRDGGITVAVGVGQSPTINVTMGRCVGGSSMLTGGVCFRIAEPVLHTWASEHGLVDHTPKALEPYYEHVEQAIHVEEVPISMRSRSTALFVAGAERQGHRVVPLRRNTRGCNGCGRCNFGCPHGAKQSVDISYLPRAVRAGAEIWSHCLVEKVSIEGGHVTGVTGRLLNGVHGRPRGRLRARAPRVVIAAGAWHTPLLLSRSRIGRRSRQVGRNLSLHPAFRVNALFDEPVRGWDGALQSAFVPSLLPEGMTMTGMFVPPGVLAATMPGVGVEHTDQSLHVDRLAIFGGLIHDEAGGRVRRGPGREPFVTYRMDRRDRAKIPRLLRAMAECFFEAGAQKVYLPILGLRGLSADALRTLDLEKVPMRLLECSSQHPLGSARMGASPSRSVVNPDGHAWDVGGLYVADGSIVPTSLGLNPQLAIMTLATRIAWTLRDGGRPTGPEAAPTPS